MKRSRAEIRDELGRRIARISGEDFIRRYVLLPEHRAAGLGPADAKVSIVQNDGTGAATVEYAVGGSARLFAKLYPDGSGPHAYQVLRALWRAGFNREHRYRVPEPLGFVAELNLLLMRGAPGESVADALGSDGDRVVRAVREAARWLLALHASPVRVGRLDQPWYLFRKLSDRLAKAAAAHPQELKRLTVMVDHLQAVAERRRPVEPVQAHGQFRPIHAFLSGETVTVIDLDRSQPSDPARDLAEFVHRLRSTLARDGGARPVADALTRAFLEEYARERPGGLSSLPFYHGAHVVASCCRHLRRVRPEEPEWPRTLQFYTDEFADAVSARWHPSRSG
jgi:hypothetical protein